MNLRALKLIKDKLDLKRQGNYTTITVRDKENNQSIVLAYSYETCIGLIDSEGHYWLDNKLISRATEQHKELFCKHYTIPYVRGGK